MPEEYREERQETSPNNIAFSENTSGYGAKSKVPVPVQNKFNWGAFLLTWIWGIFNKSPLTFSFIILLILTLIAFINISTITFFVIVIDLLFMLWYGIKGNTWAWQNKRYNGIAEFHEIQKKWAIGSLIFFVLCALIFSQQVANFIIKFNEIFINT